MITKLIQGCVDIVKTGLNEFALRTLCAFGAQTATGKIVGVGSSGKTIKSVAHGVVINQRIVFDSGVYVYREFSVVSVVDSDNFTVNYDFGIAPPANLDTFTVLSPVTPRLTSLGGIATSDPFVLSALSSINLELFSGDILVNPFSSTGTSLVLFTSASTGINKVEIKENAGLCLVVEKNGTKIGNILPGGQNTFLKSLVPGDTIGLSVVSSGTGIGEVSWNLHK